MATFMNMAMITRLFRRLGLWLANTMAPCPCGFAWEKHRHPFPAEASTKTCGVCGTPLLKGTLKTHDGRWRCREHKQHL